MSLERQVHINKPAHLRTDQGSDLTPKVSPTAAIPVDAPSVPVDAKQWLATHLPRFILSKDLYLRLAHGPDALYLLAFHDEKFEAFLQQGKEDLGDKFVPAIQNFLKEARSTSLRMLLLLSLGMLNSEDSMQLLKEELAAGRDPTTMGAAAYALGLIKNPGGFDFVREHYSKTKPRLDLGLRSSLEAAMALRGEPAFPFLLEIARSELAGKSPDEARRLVQAGYGRWFESLRYEHLSPEIKRLAEEEPSFAIRSTLLMGIAKHGKKEDYEYLARLYSSSDDATREVVVRGILTDRGFDKADWSRKADELKGSLDQILAQLPQSPQDPHFARNLVALATLTDSEAARKWLDGFLALDHKALYGGHSNILQGQLVELLSPSGLERHKHYVKQVLDSATDLGERALLVREIYKWDAPLTDPGHIRALVEGAAALSVREHEFRVIVDALSKADGEQESVSIALQSLYKSDIPPARRVDVLAYTGNLGGVVRPFLENILRSSDEAVMRLHAARQLLRISPQDDSSVRDLVRAFVPDVWHPVERSYIRGDPYYAYGPNGDAYARLIGDFYGRYGTLEDIPRLEQLAEFINFDSSVPDRWAKMYKQNLRYSCRSASDLILLRSMRK